MSEPALERIANARAQRPPRARRAAHGAAARIALKRLRAQRVASALTVLLVALALSLPLLLSMGLRNVDQLGRGVAAAREIEAYLTPGLEDAAVTRAIEAARALPGVVAVERRTPAQGLALLSELPGAADLLAGLERNPLPEVLVVAPAAEASAQTFAGVAAALGALDAVDHVSFDLALRERFAHWLSLAERVVYGLTGLLALAALLTIGQAVWRDVVARRDEIEVVAQLGGDGAFIARPFLWSGALLGAMAALVASALAAIAWLGLAPTVAALALEYGSDFALHGAAPGALLAVLIGGPVLGWFGARLAVARELRALRPERGGG